MKALILVIVLAWGLVIPVYGETLSAPEPNGEALDLMPVKQNSFGEDLWYVIRKGIEKVEPEIAQCTGICLCVSAVVMLISVLSSFPGNTRPVIELSGAVAVGCLLLGNASGLIQSAVDTVRELSDYGKLLLPVMGTALAAQGGVTGSAALYTGTAIFDAVLSWLIACAIVPLIYIYLVLALASAALHEEVIGKLKDTVKWLTCWTLKIVLYVFTGYMTITGVVSGSTDQMALKATKMTISGMVPVVGGILSDASEAVLVSAGVVKNAVGVYGLVALIAISIGPFLRIGIQYLLLKLTASICGVFGSKQITGLVSDVGGAMGILLAMTGTVCLLLVISMVCFMKGVG